MLPGRRPAADGGVRAGLTPAAELNRAALDDVRSQGLAVLPICPFVQEWMRRHPDYQDLDYRRPDSRVTD